jgi:recombination protein RecA
MGSAIRELAGIRMKIGVTFGSHETTTGGNALQVLLIGAPRHPARWPDQDSNVVVGNRTRVRVVKKKMAPPYHARGRSRCCCA